MKINKIIKSLCITVLLPTSLKLRRTGIRHRFIKFLCPLLIGSASLAMDIDRSEELHEAVKTENLYWAKALLDAGVPVDSLDKDGNPPLIHAANRGNIGICQLLLKHNANIEGIGHSYTPLWYAARSGYYEACKLLIDHHAQIDAKCFRGETPLMAAISYSRICQLLLEHNAQANETRTDGTTPLMLAADKGDIIVCQLLLEHKAQVDTKNNEGKTPLKIATEKAHLETCQILIEYNAQVDTRDNEGRTPLLHAVVLGNWGLCQLFLNCNAQIHVKDKSGNTPWGAATWNGPTHIVNLELCKLLVHATAKQIGQHQRAALTVLGIFRRATCRKLISKDVGQLIARQIYQPAMIEKLNLLSKINKIGESFEKKELFDYTQKQLHNELNPPKKIKPQNPPQDTQQPQQQQNPPLATNQENHQKDKKHCIIA
jgi:ankyrin repeat protein